MTAVNHERKHPNEQLHLPRAWQTAGAYPAEVPLLEVVLPEPLLLPLPLELLLLDGLPFFADFGASSFAMAALALQPRLLRRRLLRMCGADAQIDCVALSNLQQFHGLWAVETASARDRLAFVIRRLVESRACAIATRG